MPEGGQCRISTGCERCTRAFWEIKSQLDSNQDDLAAGNLNPTRFGCSGVPIPIHDVLREEELYLELL